MKGVRSLDSCQSRENPGEIQKAESVKADNDLGFYILYNLCL